VTRVNIADGSVDTTWTAPKTYVSAAALSADGYLYAASFGDIGDIHGGLARFPLSSHGLPDAAWQPAASTDPHTTYVLAFLPGDDGSVIVAGEFATMGGLARANLARLVGPTGAADPDWRADTDAGVSHLSYTSDGAILVGGQFARIGTAERASLARIDDDGTPDSTFIAGVYNRASVTTLLPDPASGRLYVGGRFDWVGTERHRNLLRLDASGQLDAAWLPDVGTPAPVLGAAEITMGVQAIALAGPHVYVAGMFSSVEGVARNALARVDVAAPGHLDASWDPALRGEYFDATSAQSSVEAMIVDDQGRLLIGGDFTAVGDSGTAMIARFGSDGAVDGMWHPTLIYPVARIADDHAGHLYAITQNAQFAVSTPHKVSADTGASDDAWDQAASLGTAFDVVVGHGDDLFVAGGVDTVNTGVLKLSQTTGAINAHWTPITSCLVRSLALDGTSLYAAGNDFSGDPYHACVQRIDQAGVLDPTFAPEWLEDSATYSLAVAGGAVYVGGVFDHVGDVERRALAAFDAVDVIFQNGFDE
jgi:hypothetical protein